MSGKKANNYPGLRPIKGQQPGPNGNTRVRDQLSSLSLNALSRHNEVRKVPSLTKSELLKMSNLP
jgi:hypothetical protein